MRRRLEVLARNAELRKNIIVVDYTEYNKVIDKRKILPKYVKDKIDICLKEIIIRHPGVQKIYLVGSYASGEYIDENTDQEFKDLKKSVYKTVKISDFDFETEPFINNRFVTREGYKIDILKTREKDKVLVHDRNR